jgi:YD repeat-containing protein
MHIENRREESEFGRVTREWWECRDCRTEFRALPPLGQTMTKTIREYDNNGKCIYYRNSVGYAWWREYDTNGKLIHSRDSHGYEVWCDYDTNGKWIHFRDSNGFEVWREYHTNGKLIHFRDSNGLEVWREYDTNGKLINTRNTSGATDLALAPQPSVPSGEAVRNALRRVLDNADWDDLADLANAMTGQRDVNTHEMADALLAAPPQERVSEVTEAMAFAAWAECIRIEENATPFAAPEMWEQVKPAWMSIVRAALAPSRRAPSGDGGGRDA